MNINLLISEKTRHIIRMIVNGEYDEVVELTNGIRLPKEEIVYAISDYGFSLVNPPEVAYECLDVVEITNSSHREWSVRMPLWTIEEGRSDLSIEFTMIEVIGKWLRVELDNISIL